MAGIGVPRTRFRMPSSRRYTRTYASAVKVVAITLMPAMPGISTSSSSLSLANAVATSSSSSSGSTKLKKAALGLRQNSLRSKRNCSQVRAAGSLGRSSCGQLEIDVLERRPRDLEPVEPLAARERVARQPVQEVGRVVGLVLHAPARRQVGDAVARPAPGRARSGGPSATMRPSLTIATRSASSWASSR